jgi:hypothetical protein
VLPQLQEELGRVRSELIVWLLLILLCAT